MPGKDWSHLIQEPKHLSAIFGTKKKEGLTIKVIQAKTKIFQSIFRTRAWEGQFWLEVCIMYELLSHVIERSSNIVFLFKELENIRIDA
jgi:hypothetical protein